MNNQIIDDLIKSFHVDGRNKRKIDPHDALHIVQALHELKALRELVGRETHAPD